MSLLLEFERVMGAKDALNVALETFQVSLQPQFISRNRFFVNPNGDDLAPGTLIAPWKSLEKAATAPPYSDVFLMSGTYRGRLIPQNDNLTFLAFPGEKPLIDANTQTSLGMQGIVHLEGRRGILLDGLSLANGSYGVFTKGCEDVVVRNVRLHRTYHSGIYTDASQNIKVLGCELTEVTHGSGAGSEWISMRGVRGFEVAENYLHQCALVNGVRQGKEGIDAKTGSSDGVIRHNRISGMNRIGLYVDGYNVGVRKIQVFGNLVEDCLHGIVVNAEQGGLVQEVSVWGNLSRGHAYQGLGLGHSTTVTIRLEDVVMDGNWVEDCLTGIRMAASSMTRSGGRFNTFLRCKTALQDSTSSEFIWEGNTVL